ncbi:MAG: Importin-5, partial [Paramarteilia canceri]
IMSKLVDNEISNSKEKASKLFFKKNEEIDDMDIYDYYEDEDEDESFLYVVDHFTCGMFSLLGEKYIPAFQSYESKIDHFIGDLNLQLVEDDVHSALLIYISIIEKAQDAVLSSYSSKFSDILLKFLNQPHRPTLFHAAVYGFGIIAKKNLPQYREFLIAAIPKVIEFVQSNAKNIDEDEPVLLAYENAISALIRVVRYADFILPSDDSEKRRLQYLILTNLPFKADTAELANCYEWICLLVQNQGESLQNDSQTFEQILRILLESYTFSRQNIENSLMNQVKICLQNLSRLNNFQPMLMKLSSSHQNAYKTIISNDKASNM